MSIFAAQRSRPVPREDVPVEVVMAKPKQKKSCDKGLRERHPNVVVGYAPSEPDERDATVDDALEATSCASAEYNSHSAGAAPALPAWQGDFSLGADAADVPKGGRFAGETAFTAAAEPSSVHLTPHEEGAWQVEGEYNAGYASAGSADSIPSDGLWDFDSILADNPLQLGNR
jgi:hypothetical protein